MLPSKRWGPKHLWPPGYFMPMGDVGGKVAVAFGVLFVLLVVGVALKEVMD